MNNNDKIVTLESYYDPMLAEIIRGRLEANGIPCFLADDNIVNTYPLYNQMVGGVKIKVFEYDLEKCREILAQNEIITETEEAVTVENQSVPATTCPYCHSSDVRFGTGTERRASWFGIIISLLLLIYPFHANKAWHCFNCGKDFK